MTAKAKAPLTVVAAVAMALLALAAHFECVAHAREGAFPNLDYLGRGYNLLYGNPLDADGDPGYRLPVFRMTYEEERTTATGRPLPDGVDVIEVPVAQLSSSYTSFNREEDIRREALNKVDTQRSTSVSASYLAVGFDSANAFAKSRSFQSAAQAVSSQAATIVKQTSSVVAYRATIEDSLPLSSAICSAAMSLLDVLPVNLVASTPGELARTFSLFDRFGTHATTHVTMGGTATQLYKFQSSSDETAETIENAINKQSSSSSSFGAKFQVDLGFEAASSEDRNLEATRALAASAQREGASSDELFSGGDPSEAGFAADSAAEGGTGLGAWAGSVPDNPVPVNIAVDEMSAVLNADALLQCATESGKDLTKIDASRLAAFVALGLRAYCSTVSGKPCGNSEENNELTHLSLQFGDFVELEAAPLGFLGQETCDMPGYVRDNGEDTIDTTIKTEVLSVTDVGENAVLFPPGSDWCIEGQEVMYIESVSLREAGSNKAVPPSNVLGFDDPSSSPTTWSTTNGLNYYCFRYTGCTVSPHYPYSHSQWCTFWNEARSVAHSKLKCGKLGRFNWATNDDLTVGCLDNSHSSYQALQDIKNRCDGTSNCNIGDILEQVTFPDFWREENERRSGESGFTPRTATKFFASGRCPELHVSYRCGKDDRNSRVQFEVRSPLPLEQLERGPVKYGAGVVLNTADGYLAPDTSGTPSYGSFPLTVSPLASRATWTILSATKPVGTRVQLDDTVYLAYTPTGVSASGAPGSTEFGFPKPGVLHVYQTSVSDYTFHETLRLKTLPAIDSGVISTTDCLGLVLRAPPLSRTVLPSVASFMRHSELTMTPTVTQARVWVPETGTLQFDVRVKVKFNVPVSLGRDRIPTFPSEQSTLASADFRLVITPPQSAASPVTLRTILASRKPAEYELVGTGTVALADVTSDTRGLQELYTATVTVHPRTQSAVGDVISESARTVSLTLPPDTSLVAELTRGTPPFPNATSPEDLHLTIAFKAPVVTRLLNPAGKDEMLFYDRDDVDGLCHRLEIVSFTSNCDVSADFELHIAGCAVYSAELSVAATPLTCPHHPHRVSVLVVDVRASRLFVPLVQGTLPVQPAPYEVVLLE